MVVPTGVIMPPPIPWSMRNAMREPALQARPHRAEPAVNMASATAKVFFVPKRSPIQPEAGIQTAKLTR